MTFARRVSTIIQDESLPGIYRLYNMWRPRFRVERGVDWRKLRLNAALKGLIDETLAGGRALRPVPSEVEGTLYLPASSLSGLVSCPFSRIS